MLIRADKLIGVVSQKDSLVEEPTVSDLVRYWNGCKNCQTNQNA